MKTTKSIYVFLFVCILLLTQSNYWVQYDSSPAFLGLPAWMGYFIIFHLLFVIVLYFFVQKPSE